ncbi:MAG: hypothetical protein PVH62_05780 [Anaerolineae bacterium]|jgi:hypothetical protein
MDAKELDLLIEEGVAAAKARHKEEAEELLREAVDLDPGNERAWLWLSAVTEGVEAQKECLRRVLEVNPDNTFARSGLRFLSHLREGHEYMAARAPWVSGAEDDQIAMTDLPSHPCPSCGALNPGWAYLCTSCAAPLRPTDVSKAVKNEMRTRSSPPLTRSWSSAIAFDVRQAFAPEIALASPLRAILVVTIGTIALNLLRVVGTLELAAFNSTRLPVGFLDRLMVAFIGDQLRLLVGGLLAWVLLAMTTQIIARSQGGLARPMVHYYLVGVAVSAWMPVTGLTGLVWWTVAELFQVAPSLLASLACGLAFFHAVTLLVQAIRVAHDVQTPVESAAIGVLLTVCTLIYAGLLRTSSPQAQSTLIAVARTLLLPVSP